jgi:hypothetical protein
MGEQLPARTGGSWDTEHDAEPAGLLAGAIEVTVVKGIVGRLPATGPGTHHSLSLVAGCTGRPSLAQ